MPVKCGSLTRLSIMMTGNGGKTVFNAAVPWQVYPVRVGNACTIRCIDRVAGIT